MRTVGLWLFTTLNAISHDSTAAADQEINVDPDQGMDEPEKRIHGISPE